MKKSTSKNLSKKLAKYGAMSLAIAGVSNAMGQVDYTDIDPDETIDDTSYDVDFNNDGTIDFTITNSGASGAAVRMYNTQSNSVLGANFGGNYNYPYVLVNSAPIASSGNFTAHPYYQTLNWNGCAYTNSNWCGGITDAFVGVRFNVGAEQHYGWIQLDVPADATTFTIKGFAFEATPDTEILAGDTGLGIDQNAFEGFTYFMDENSNLNLKAATAIESVSVFNVLGQNVINKSLNANSALVAMDGMTSGVYIATVTIEGQKQSFKVIKK